MSESAGLRKIFAYYFSWCWNRFSVELQPYTHQQFSSSFCHKKLTVIFNTFDRMLFTRNSQQEEI